MEKFSLNKAICLKIPEHLNIKAEIEKNNVEKHEKIDVVH